MASFQAENFTLIGKKLKEGETAPDFKLVDKNSQIKTLKDYEGKIKIISCFPSIDTSVCNMQTKTFAKEYSNVKDVVVLNVSVDLPFALDRWCEENGINVIGLSSQAYVNCYGALLYYLKNNKDLIESKFENDEDFDVTKAINRNGLSSNETSSRFKDIFDD